MLRSEKLLDTKVISDINRVQAYESPAGFTSLRKFGRIFLSKQYQIIYDLCNSWEAQVPAVLGSQYLHVLGDHDP